MPFSDLSLSYVILLTVRARCRLPRSHSNLKNGENKRRKYFSISLALSCLLLTSLHPQSRTWRTLRQILATENSDTSTSSDLITCTLSSFFFPQLRFLSSVLIHTFIFFRLFPSFILFFSQQTNLFKPLPLSSPQRSIATSQACVLAMSTHTHPCASAVSTHTQSSHLFQCNLSLSFSLSLSVRIYSIPISCVIAGRWFKRSWSFATPTLPSDETHPLSHSNKSFSSFTCIISFTFKAVC